MGSDLFSRSLANFCVVCDFPRGLPPSALQVVRRNHAAIEYLQPGEGTHGALMRIGGSWKQHANFRLGLYHDQ